MQEPQCCHPGCTNHHSAPVYENALTTYDQMVTLGWFKSGSGWLCAQHGPYAKSPSGTSSTFKAAYRSAIAPSPPPTVAKATPKQSNAKQWTVVVLVAIVIIIVIAVAGNGANNASNKAYSAGYDLGYNSNNFVPNDQAGSYCQDLWNNLSGSELSKYSSNEGNWVGGCTDGVKAAH